jgi:hypothetical protein
VLTSKSTNRKVHADSTKNKLVAIMPDMTTLAMITAPPQATCHMTWAWAMI